MVFLNLKGEGMEAKKIRAGVIGVGHLGRHHARIYSEMSQVELVGIYDTNPDQARQIAEVSRTESYESLAHLLDAVDAVSVATPTNTHHDIVRQALEADCHVIVEKPITVSVSDADDIVTLAANKGLKLQVGHIERFNGAIQAVHERITSPLFIECHRLAPFNPRGTDVSVILDLTIHDLDIVLGFVPSRVVSIHAVGVPVISNSIDIANVRLEFENGCVANITTSRVSAKVTRKIRFFQKDAYFSIDMLTKSVDVFEKKADLRDLIQQDASGYTQIKGSPDTSLIEKIVSHQTITADQVEPLRVELDAFVSCIVNDTEPIVSGRDGRNALALAHQIIGMIEQKKSLV